MSVHVCMALYLTTLLPHWMLLDRVCVSFADGVIKLLENSFPPLIHRVILLEQLSLADGLQPLQQKHTHHHCATFHVPVAGYKEHLMRNAGFCPTTVPLKACSKAANPHLDDSMLRLTHKQNLTVTQELGAHHMQQRLPAALSPNVMMLPSCQQVSMHMCCLRSCREVQ